MLNKGSLPADTMLPQTITKAVDASVSAMFFDTIDIITPSSCPYLRVYSLKREQTSRSSLKNTAYSDFYLFRYRPTPFHSQNTGTRITGG